VPRKDVRLNKITAEKDRLSINTKVFYGKGGEKRNITFDIFGIDMKDVKQGNSNKIEQDVKGEPEEVKVIVNLKVNSVASISSCQQCLLYQDIGRTWHFHQSSPTIWKIYISAAT